MLPRTNLFAVLGLVIFFLAILGYSYFEARNIIYGPVIVLKESDQAVVRDQMILVTGVAKNITEIRMNGRLIPTTEAGGFEEAHLLAEGYNAILLTARDKIGRTTTETIEVVYESPVSVSTTTESIL